MITTLALSKHQKLLHTAPSIKSGKIECKYSLVFEFESDGMCVKNIGDFEIPIGISPQVMEIPRVQPNAPPEWNPVTYEVKSISYAHAEAYYPSAPPLEDED